MSDVQRRDYELDDVVTVEEPERLKAIADPLRNHIIDLVLERAMSVTELSEIVGRPKGSVAYHVNVLVDAGLLKVVRTRRVRALEERFYGRVARTIVLPKHGTANTFINDMVNEIDHERVAHGKHALTTYRHARIPIERVDEYIDRLDALTLEFVDEPRGGDTEYGLFVSIFPTNRLRAPEPHRNEDDHV